VNQDWDIKPRSDTCHGCEKPFADAEPYFSALVFGDQGYVRADCCETCWQRYRQTVQSPYSTWQGVYRKPPAPEEPLKKETAESLLRQLMEQEDRSKVNVVYILAVMLERKRALVERDVQQREDGTRVRVYEHRKTGETFLIPEPSLQLDQLEEVQQEVVALLGARDDAEAEPVPEPPPPAEPPAESPDNLRDGFYSKQPSTDHG